MNAEDLLLNFTPIWRKQLLNIMDFPNLGKKTISYNCILQV